MMTNHLWITTLLAVLFASTAAAADEKITYDDHVLPIFREHCLACHDSGGRSGDLSLESYADAMTGGASGEVLAAGLADESRLYNLMAHVEKPVMPPGDDPLPDKQLQIVAAWINGGLLENAGSKAKQSRKPAVAAFQATADNRPVGEPAMPSGFYRQPVLHSAAAGAVPDVAASPWAPLIAVGGQRQVLLYHADTRELLAVVPFVVGTPQVVRFSRNGDLLLVAGGRGASLGVAHLWDIKSGARIAELGDELDTILAADISADHTLVAIGGPRRRVQVLYTADGSLAYSITKHTDWATALEFSPDGKLLATADRSGNAYLWESTTGRPVAGLAGHKAAITSLSWRGDSQLLATAADDGEVRTWQRQGTAVKQWKGGAGIQDIAFTTDGHLVTAGRDRVAKLWDTSGKQLKKFATLDDIALAVATTHDGTLGIVADWTGAVKLAKLESGEAVGTLTSNPPTLAMRLEATMAELAALQAKLPEAKQAVAAVDAKIERAQSALAKHQAAKQSVTGTIAKLEQSFVERRKRLDNHRLALKQLDQTLADLQGKRAVAERQLGNLNEQLAAVTNLEDEGADGSEADALQREIDLMEERLGELGKQEDDQSGRRPELAKAREAAKQQVDQLAGQIAQQQESLGKLTARDGQLPDIAVLTQQRDEALGQLEAKRQSVLGLRGDIASLESELAAYRAAQQDLEAQLAEQAQQARTKESLLSSYAEQLASKQQQLDSLQAEVEQLRQQLAAVEAKQESLTEATNETRTAASAVEAQLDQLSADKAKAEKAVADLRAAAELRERFAPAD